MALGEKDSTPPLSHATEYVWDGQNLAAETKQGTTDTYTYDMTGVHTRKRGNAVTSYLKDYHGNVIGTAGSTGRLDYDAYGNQIQGGTPDPFGYCGEYYDSETGLIYLRNRYYDPTTGRFINEDLIKDGLNWYVYCEGNPIMFVDPRGLESYVFVSDNMVEQAEVRRKHYSKKYNTDTHIVRIKSADDFVYRWNNIFSVTNKNGISIDAIEIISHGSIDGKVGKGSDGTAYSTGYIYFTDSKKNKLYARNISGMKNGDRSVETLLPVVANELNLEGCNTANKDTYNIVYGFMQKVSANSYSGFDGGAQWSEKYGDHIRGGGDFTNDVPFWAFGDPWYYVKKHQYTWWKYVSKNHNGNPVRDREGRRYF